MTIQPSVFVRPYPRTPRDLNEAVRLSLTSVAATSRASALVAYLVDLVVAQERAGGRQNGRRAAGLQKLSTAVEAMLGGLLRSWGRSKPRWVYHLVGRSEFTGERVAARQFLAVIAALRAADLIAVVPGFANSVDFEGDGNLLRYGRATRFCPTATLLGIVEAHGVTPESVEEDFIDVFPAEPPSVPDPVILRPLKAPRRKGAPKVPTAPVGLDPSDPLVCHFVGEVNSFNAFAANFDVQGCRPPRWYRTFTEHFLYGGRWIAAGSEGNYQRLPQAQRLRITIDGMPVASLDISASHLSIMLGLAGRELPQGDPYALDGLPRAVVKQLAVVTAGLGALPRQWPSDTPPEIAAIPIADAAAALVAAYPFMREPWRLVRSDYEPKQAKRLFVHRLMGIEASAITFAMQMLKAEGIFAMPVHDELIVPAHAAPIGKELLGKAFRSVTNVQPRIKEAMAAEASLVADACHEIAES